MKRIIENSNKICKNCKFFSKHYAFSSGNRLIELSTGHCVNLNLNLRTTSKIVAKNSGCEFWESFEKQIEERKQSVVETIESIKKRLDEIALIFGKWNGEI